jgi:hypothetical protein
VSLGCRFDFCNSEKAEQVMLRFTQAPSQASDNMVSEARKRRPTILMNSISSCHMHQLFRGGLLRAILGLCITPGLVASSWCIFDNDLELLRRWLLSGLFLTWGAGLPHFLAVLGSGIKILQHDRGLPEVQVCAAPRRRISGLLVASMALTAWQCWWWVKGIKLLVAARQPSNMVFYLFCLGCCIFWPVAWLSTHRKDAREQGKAMKGAAASILLMPLRRRLSSLGMCRTDSTSSVASTALPTRLITDSSLSTLSGASSASKEKLYHCEELSTSQMSMEV